MRNALSVREQGEHFRRRRGTANSVYFGREERIEVKYGR